MRGFEEKLREYRDLTENALVAAIPETSDSGAVFDAMRYSLLGGGKRVRGILSLACCELAGGVVSDAFPAAAAVEMIHAYSLIHDDLPCMDDDALRRGKPSCHVAFGQANALLAGDALLTLAFEKLADVPDERSAIRCISALAAAAGYKGMIRGQELDISAEGKSGVSESELYLIHSHKTGKLITAAAVMGVILGGGNETDIDVARRFAENIGLVFQIVDDLLDVNSNENILGKQTGGDAKAGKLTFAAVYGQARSSEIAEDKTEEAAELLRSRFGEKASFLTEFARNLLKRIN